MSSANEETRKYYSDLYSRLGAGPAALGWSKGNQFLRYEQLVEGWDLSNRTFLDVGCGFGDFLTFLRQRAAESFYYVGIDLMEPFIAKGRERHAAENTSFVCGDFLETPFELRFDYVVASGTFNLDLGENYGYDYIFATMEKMFELSTRAISLDFLSDKVDYSHDHNFNSSPEKILSLAYSLSRKVTLRNNTFPFEFSVTVFKDDSFDPVTSVFRELAATSGPWDMETA